MMKNGQLIIFTQLQIGQEWTLTNKNYYLVLQQLRMGRYVISDYT